jgi:hypothetical protein
LAQNGRTHFVALMSLTFTVAFQDRLDHGFAFVQGSWLGPGIERALRCMEPDPQSLRFAVSPPLSADDGWLGPVPPSSFQGLHVGAGLLELPPAILVLMHSRRGLNGR